MADQETVKLRAGEKTQEFTKTHAARLLAYPGTQWKELTAEKAEGQALSPAREGEQEAPATGRKMKAN